MINWYTTVGTVALVFGSFWVFKKLFNSNPKSASVQKTPRVITLPVIDCSRESLINDIEKTRSNPIKKLPISVDLPRLARKTVILDGEEPLFDGPSLEANFEDDTSNESRCLLIQQLWEIIAKLVNEERDCYNNLAKELDGGDIAAQLATFLDKNYDEDSKVIRILKVSKSSIFHFNDILLIFR